MKAGGLLTSKTMKSSQPTPKPRPGRSSAPLKVLACSLLAATSLPAASPVLSINFNGFTSNGVDAVRVNGADNSIAVTGGGSNAASPATQWLVPSPAYLDTLGAARIVAPGGTVYGDAALANSQLKQGSVFTTRGDFTFISGTVNAAIRYATGTSPARGYVQVNSTALNDARFNTLFQIKPGAPFFSGWELGLRYGTGGTTVDGWHNNTAAQNGSVTAEIYSVDATTGTLSTAPVVTFTSASAAGAGPVVQLAANGTAGLLPGAYLLSIRSSGKTITQRATIDDIVLSANAGPVEVTLDNNSPSGVAVTGSWTLGTYGTGFYGVNFLTDAYVAKGSLNVRYSPNLVEGVYTVSVRYPAAADNDVAVPVNVAHAQGTEYLSINQTSNGGVWMPLGNYRFIAGQPAYVEIANAGTTGLVVADAVRFTPVSVASDPEVLADGLVSWRKPDMDGITCAQCHGPAGYDIATFSFSQADVRVATQPHLPESDADAIFRMIELHRRRYPIAGGTKDVTTFRPFQPTGVVLGGATATSEQRDAAFGNHAAANFLFAQGRVETLAQAHAAKDQLLNLDIDSVPIGIAFNRWSESVARQGAADGGKIAEWLPAIGQQILGANQAAFLALENAYIANPTDANFWAMFHKIDAWATPDPVNNAPVTSPNWRRMAKEQFKSNLVFQHDQLKKSMGTDNWVTGRSTVRPFQDQENQGSVLSFLWDVADAARIVKNTPFAELPLRNQESMFIDTANPITTQINRLRNTWFYLGWTMDHSLFFTGPSNSTRSGEYFIEQLWTENLRAHQVFFNITHAVKRGYQPGGWATGNSGGLVQYFNSYKNYYLGYNKYKKGTDAPGYAGSAATYMNMLANSVRMLALLHENDIQNKGKVYGDRAAILNHIPTMRAALDWADLPNKTANDALLDSLTATINAYPNG
jgi:hypothetical protein